MGEAALKPSYLIDSAILIDHLRGVPQASRWLGSLKDREAAISVITRAEVLSGGENQALASATLLCDQFTCLDITKAIADRAADLRRRHHWKLPDAFQAAIVLQYGLRLATRNTKDFQPGNPPYITIPFRL